MIQKEDWKEISLATRAQILLNYNNLDFFKGDFKLVDIYQENNKKNLDWFYVESKHALVKSAKKTKDGKYNFSFPIEKEQDIAKMDAKSIFGRVGKIDKIIFGCFDIENSKIYRLEKTFYNICKNVKNSKYTLTEDNLRSEKILEVKEDFLNSWKALSKAEKVAKNSKNTRLEGFKGMANFFNWYNNQEKKCAYCGIHVEQIKALGENKKLNNKRSDIRGYTLEIDRMLPKLEYSEENCCMACYWCNNAKTDEFSPEEFKPIARGINEVWNKRLETIWKEGSSFKREFIFDEKSEIWKIDFDKEMNSKTK